MAPVEPTHPYISSTEASKRYGITGDHVGLLCRRGKVRAVLVGRMWFVEEDSLTEYLDDVKKKREERRSKLSKEFSKAWATLALLLVTLAPSHADAHMVTGLFAPGFERFTSELSSFVAALPQPSSSQPLFEKHSIRKVALSFRLPEVQLPQVTFNTDVRAHVAAVSMSPVKDFLCGTFSIWCNRVTVAVGETVTAAVEPTNPVRQVQPSVTEYVASVQAESPLADQVLYSDAFDPRSYVTFAFLEEQVRRIYDSLGEGLRKTNTSSSGSDDSSSSLSLDDATGTLAIGKGGTGLTTTPSYGQLLMGTANGAFSLIATSSLGITGSSQWTTNSPFGIYYSGKVGIGTTTPTRTKVQIVAPNNGDPALMLTNMDADTNKKHRWITAGDDGSLQFGQSDDELGMSSVDIVMDTNGRLGIGTTTPGTLLSIGGDGFNQGINISDTATSTFGFGINVLTGCFAVNGVCITGGSGSSQWSTSGSAVYYSTGNVGIGTTSPYAKLSVVGEAVARNFTATSTTATSYFAGNVGVGTSTSAAKFAVSYSDNSFARGLVVTNSNSGSNAISGIAITDRNGTYKGVLDFLDSNYNNAALANTVLFGTPDNTKLAFVGGTGSGTPDIYFQSGWNVAPALYIKGATSNVGIGTTSPFAKLSLVGNLFVGGTITATSTATSTFSGGLQALVLNVSGTTASSTFANGINLTGGCFAINGTCITSGGAGSLTGTTGQVAYFSGTNTAIGTSSLFIAANGNVGVGTTSPYAKLSVVGEAVARNFTATSTTATSTFAGGLNVGSGALTYDYSAGLTTIQNLAFGSMSFDTDSGIVSWIDVPVTSNSSNGTVQSYTAFIDGENVLTVYGESSGSGSVKNLRVGVGTTSPYATLAVQATTTQSYPVFEVASSSSATKFLTVSGTGFGTTTLSGLSIAGSATSTSNVGFNLTGGCFAINGTCLSGGTSLTGTTGQVTYFNGTNTAVGTSSLYISTTGRVGIGITTPTVGLHVARDSQRYTSSITYGLHISEAGSPTKVLGMGFDALADIGYIQAVHTSNADKNLALQPNGANVGIGTTTPGSKLSVSGAVSIGASYGVAAPSNSLIVEGDVGIGTSTPSSPYLPNIGKLVEIVNSTADKNAAINITTTGTTAYGSGSGITFSNRSQTSNDSRVSQIFASRINSNTTSLDGQLVFSVSSASTLWSVMTLQNRNVGIGSTTPWGRLVVTNDSTGPSFVVEDQGSIDGTPFIIDAEGSVGIGLLAPGYKLDVLSTTTNIARFQGSSGTGCTFSSGGIIACSSDRTLKKNITNLSESLHVLTGLRPVTFNWNSDTGTTSPTLGFIAQEVELLLPSLVTTDQTTGLKSLNQIGLIPVIVKAVQEIYTSITGFAEKFTTKQLCVEDVCVTREQFLAIVQAAGQSPSAPEVPVEEEVESAPPVEEEAALEEGLEEGPADETPDTIEEEPAEVSEPEETVSEPVETESPEGVSEPVALETE